MPTGFSGLPSRPEASAPPPSEVEVAIVVPFLDTAPEHLREAVTSAAAQTIPVDVVLVDDGSRDPGTHATVTELLAVPCFRLVRHPQNLGVAAAINTGFAAATAPYVLVMGSDDVVEATYAELARDVLDGDPGVSIVTTDIQRFGASHEVDRTDGAPNGVRDMLFHNVISGASVCRRSDWEEVGGYAPLAWGEDYEFWLRVLARGGRCVRLDAIQYRYRIHEGQATQTLSAAEKLADRLEIVSRNREIWADHLDVVMERLWQQEEALAYFKRRYGRVNDVKSSIVSAARAFRGRGRRARTPR